MRTKLLTVAILTLCLRASSAFADPIIEFGTGVAGSGGTLSFAGGSSPLIGSNLRIGMVRGIDTPANEGVFSVDGNTVSYGVLDFTSGPFQGYLGGQYLFGPGTFEIHGNVDDADISGSGSGALLMSGSLDFASVAKLGLLSLSTLSGTDDIQVNSSLLDFFGLGPDTLFVLSSTEMATGSIGAGSPFSLNAFSSDWVAVDPPSENGADEIASAPEPASLLLLGSGLTILGSTLRRRTRQQAAARVAAPLAQ